MKPLDSLEPDFKALVEQLLQAISQVTERTWVVTSGRRSMEDQRRIYAQGRTEKGQIVSNAPPGASPHNYGLGADLAPLISGTHQIDWKAPRGMWRQMADLAKEMGLTAGYYFQTITDMPHVEHPRWKLERALWKAGKITVP